MFRIGLVFSLVGLMSCQHDSKSIRKPSSLVELDYINYDKAISENIIDPKFEEFEGGSIEAEMETLNNLVKESIHLMNSMKSKEPEHVMARDAHAKSHGCLQASFEVDNSALPKEYRVGIFSKNKKYDAWLRFSNNDHLPRRKDNQLDLRGVAVKIMGVEGKKIIKGKEREPTQDFLMYGSKVFFIKDNADYVNFIRGLRNGNAVKVLLTEETMAGVNTGLAQLRARKFINPLNMSYFSATPIRLGKPDNNNRTAIKYGVEPCKDSLVHSRKITRNDHNYMRENMRLSLLPGKSEGACYDFKVQLQSFPEFMPIEDSTVFWPEAFSKTTKSDKRGKFSPYVRVARVNIKPQIFSKNDGSLHERDKYCENLSFSPWHALVEHKPLGRTMRMRREIYKATSSHRRRVNRAETKEPSFFEID